MFHEFVAVFISCIDVPEPTRALDKAVRLPVGKIETPDALNVMAFVPMFTMVINAPIGNATDAFVGIVIVCAPVLLE
jgi:hypothetical protein